VYQAGTLSGNPIAMIAGYTLLKQLNENPSIYTDLENKTAALEKGLAAIFAKKGTPIQINRVGSMISLHFSSAPITDFDAAAKADNATFNRLFHHLLKQGIYLPPSAFETWFISHSISEQDIADTLAAVESFEP